MASKTITDRGFNGAAITFEKNGPGFPSVEVQVRTTAGGQEPVAVDPQTVWTGPERAQLATLLAKAYDAAKVAAGYA